MTTANHGPWLRTNVTVVELGLSRETLHKRRKEGFYVEGVHWFSTGEHPTAAIVWNIEACRNRQGTQELRAELAQQGGER